MRFFAVFAIAVSAIALFVMQAQSADLPRERGRDSMRSTPPVTQKRVAVVVDRLSLANGCPRDPACIAPRVLPIVGWGDARDRVEESISIPVDPRYVARY